MALLEKTCAHFKSPGEQFWLTRRCVTEITRAATTAHIFYGSGIRRLGEDEAGCISDLVSARPPLARLFGISSRIAL
jgi:hypothetical protein